MYLENKVFKFGGLWSEDKEGGSLSTEEQLVNEEAYNREQKQTQNPPVRKSQDECSKSKC